MIYYKCIKGVNKRKTGISLIVLVITIISTYDEANKIDRNPPENKMKIINENKVVGCNEVNPK